MVCKFINWIKDNCWIIVGILLAVNIIYVYFSDKYYFYNSQNVRYTIGKYKDTCFLVGKNPKIQYDFSYEVNGNSYNTSPPKAGWKQFPPDINWKGAELDTAYMESMNLEIP